MGDALRDIVNNGLLPNPITFIAQLISTFILFYFLKSKVWKPMQKFLAKRKEVIVGELESARNLNEEAKKNKELSEHDLIRVKEEALQVIENARSQAMYIREEIIKEAEKEAAYILEKAEKSIAQDKAKLESELKTQLVDIALIAAEKLVSENIDDSKNRQLIDKFINEVGE